MNTLFDRQDLHALACEWIARVSIRSAHAAVIGGASPSWGRIEGGTLYLDEDVIALGRRLAEYVIMTLLARAMAPESSRLQAMYLDAYLPDWRERGEELLRHKEGAA